MWQAALSFYFKVAAAKNPPFPKILCASTSASSSGWKGTRKVGYL